MTRRSNRNIGPHPATCSARGVDGKRVNTCIWAQVYAGRGSSRGAAQKYSGSYSWCKKPVARTSCVERRCSSVLRLGSSTPMKMQGRMTE
eukprot:scaffold50455_cov68-Phaeocystis_antarctica.AAC.3